MIELTSYSAERPLLLVTDYPLTMGGGGAVILQSLLTERDRERIVWTSPALAPDATAGLPLSGGSRRFSRWLRRRSTTVDTLLAGRLADEVLALAAARNAAGLWIVMHGATVHVAARILARSSLPVHLTVHDDPPFGMALMSKRYLALIPLIEHDFSRALRKARSVDVISEGMARRYRSRYQVESIVVHRGTKVPVAATPAPAVPARMEVGVLGNTYGYQQLTVLAEGVMRAAAAAGVPGGIVVVGKGHGERLREQMRGRLEVEVTGHLDEAHATDRLRRCFLLYLNYPFSWRAAVLRQTSFPTKLSTYVGAARPLLVHAPADSTLSSLTGRPDYAVWWNDEDPDSGAGLLRAAWQNPSLRQDLSAAAEETRLRYYDYETNRRALVGALNRLVSSG